MIQQLFSVKNIWYPERYHGAQATTNFFEGWYYKFEDQAGKSVCAVIAGISVNKEGNKEAFIQYVDGATHQPKYYQFSPDEFYASANDFHLKIGTNEFETNHIRLSLPDLEGELTFNKHQTWGKSIFAPNIMGVLCYWPFLECNHGLISMNNEVSGLLVKDGVEHDYNGGKGYIEKDWGASFPKAHIWLQSNRFKDSQTSLSVAIAKMQIAGVEVTGFAAVLMWKGKRFLFSTYNLAKLYVNHSTEGLELVFRGVNYQLNITSTHQRVARLITPNKKGMTGKVKESLDAVATVSLVTKRGKEPIYKDVGINTGLEVAGEW